MAGIEFVVARILELMRPGFERIGLRLGSPAVQASGVETRNADQRIALGAAIDGGKPLARPLQRPVRLDLLGLRLKVARIADNIAGLKDRQRRAVFVHRARREPCEGRAVEPAPGADRSARSEGAHECERLLFRLRGDRDQHRESHAPRRGDRKSPSDRRTTHTRSKRPCLEVTFPAPPLNKKRTMRTNSFIGA